MLVVFPWRGLVHPNEGAYHLLSGPNPRIAKGAFFEWTWTDPQQPQAGPVMFGRDRFKQIYSKRFYFYVWTPVAPLANRRLLAELLPLAPQQRGMHEAGRRAEGRGGSTLYIYININLIYIYILYCLYYNYIYITYHTWSVWECLRCALAYAFIAPALKLHMGGHPK